MKEQALELKGCMLFNVPLESTPPLDPQEPTTPGARTFLNLDNIRNYQFSYENLMEQRFT